MFSQEGNRLIFQHDGEQLWIEAWAANAFRVRATRMSTMPTEDWALLPTTTAKIGITIEDDLATFVNGNITAKITKRGKLTIWNASGKLLLEEYARHRRDPTDPNASALEV